MDQRRRDARMRERTRWLAFAIALCGCDDGVRFADSIDLDLDFRTAGVEESSELHSPYALGSTMQIVAEHGGGPAAMHGLRLESSDPSVLDLGEIDSPRTDAARVGATARAVGRGVADVWLVDDDGDVVASAEIEVRGPTRAMLHAAAPQFVDRDDVAAVAGTPSVLAGGTATFEVQLSDGATRLHGAGGLQASVGAGVDAEIVPTWFDERRDWLRVTPHEPGTHAIALAADGEPFAATIVAAVDVTAIAEVRLHGEEPSDPDDGAWVPLVGQAYDGIAQPVHGVALAWDLGGIPLDVAGELVRYRVDRRQRRTLTARFGAHEVAATVHAADP